MAEALVDDDILEGFLCPICKADLKSPNQLASHFESLHQEDQDVLTSLKAIFGKAKKILNLDESDLKETFDNALKFTPVVRREFYEPQEIGQTRSISEYYKAVRSAKLERYAAETNKLLIRLDKLVANMPTDQSQRKQHEQDIVPWLDGAWVKLCPGCAKPFNIARRQHHCRLCGSILCHECSQFFDINIAKCMIDPSKDINLLPANTDNSKTGLRLCEHCYSLIELRKQLQDSRNSKTILVTGYEQMRSLMEQALPAAAMYAKMCSSLIEGETTYHLSDANVLKSRIARYAEGIDSLSKQIAALQIAQAGSRTNKLQVTIRQAAIHFIRNDLLSVATLPTEAEITEVRRIKRENAEKRIEQERRQMQLKLAQRQAYEEQSSSRRGRRQEDDDTYMKVAQNDSLLSDGLDNPLVEQMNIIRTYIKQAREELRFEEVAILETNLKELKQEYYLQTTSKSTL